MALGAVARPMVQNGALGHLYSPQLDPGVESGANWRVAAARQSHGVDSHTKMGKGFDHNEPHVPGLRTGVAGGLGSNASCARQPKSMIRLECSDYSMVSTSTIARISEPLPPVVSTSRTVALLDRLDDDRLRNPRISPVHSHPAGKHARRFPAVLSVI